MWEGYKWGDGDDDGGGGVEIIEVSEKYVDIKCCKYCMFSFVFCDVIIVEKCMLVRLFKGFFVFFFVFEFGLIVIWVLIRMLFFYCSLLIWLRLIEIYWD